MKKVTVFRLLSVVVVLTLVLSWTRTIAVAQQDPDPAAPMAQQQAQPQQPTGAVGSMPDAETPNEKTFVGKITKSGNDLVFEDSVGESTYQLDDQTKAKPFVGKNVMVTGTVDEPTKTIHVVRIKPES